ncbi:unnamed protein product [Rotaria sordida]|uniref:Uncharacterized protein n=1 Tax=Rotaria sordida TaxID=392033 RepID=A0A819YXJ9_9BILA|nr:unnamed protein product [Rotaria sordida]CAF1526764.1 unnamed protein product [Rotaria sordida]CAF4118296.1 unnamed protein product [Rotaria sordida]CAF4155689.1 unnamed protein product [Rotaria sordida]
MASATSLSNVDDCESCVLCLSKYNRIRPSFCQCKHCSIPLCMDCMKEHHEEVLQDVAQISHQYNELKELVEVKQKMIVDETTKSIEDVNQYFKTYINELLETQEKIILDIEKAKQDAQSYVLKIDSDLRIVGIEIQGLAKQSVAQTTKAKNLSTDLKSIEQLVTFCDLEMNKLNSILLGKCDDYIEIRTDGKDRFFITTGHNRFYIIHSNGKKQTVNLQNDGDCIAVLHNRRVAVSKQRKDMEIIAY